MKMFAVRRLRFGLLLKLVLFLLLLDPLAVLVYNAAVAVDSRPAAEVPPIPGEQVDAVVVFCNGIGPYEGVDATTRERLRYAASLVQRGQAGAVAGIGCHWKVNEDIPDGMARLLSEFGLWPEAIFIDRASFDTSSNWREARAIIAREKWRRLWLLSSPLHLFRIRWLIERETPLEELAALQLENYTFRPPGSDARDVYKEVHHEWLAWGGRLLLPESVFQGYIRWRRQ